MTILGPEILNRLSEANLENDRRFPGDSADRQPIHTVYGGAHLFKAETAAILGAQALKTLDVYAPDASALGVSDAVYARVVEKLRREPVEDFRIDFEDGYGNRPDAEEDAHAVHAAQELVRGLTVAPFPPFIGIRIKPLTEALHERSLRTLDLFLATLLNANGEKLPEGFVVTLPKVTIPEQVWALVQSFLHFEKLYCLNPGALKLELMIETTQSIIDHRGQFAIPDLLEAAEGRCRGLHFGVYDYTAACNITAQYQGMAHAAAAFARHVMQVCTAGRGVTISDGATTVLPIGPHRGDALTEQQKKENRAVVRRAMKMHFEDVQGSLRNGIYQGWDLHPAQLPTRYAAAFSFFRESLPAAAARLRNFVNKAAQATTVGDVFDDAATGQGLLNFFLRGYNCGALTGEEVLSAGLTLEELRGKSFLQILNNRRSDSAE